MAVQSVPTQGPRAVEARRASTHDLSLRGGDVVTVIMDRKSHQMPPTAAHLPKLHDTIADLAQAVGLIAGMLEADHDLNPWRMGNALSGLADAILLHATLADAINSELHPEDADKVEAA